MNGMPSTPSQKSIDVCRSAPTIVMWWTPWLWILRMRASLDRRPSCQDPYFFLSVALRLLPMVAAMRCRLAGVIAGAVVLAMLVAGPAYASKGAYFGTAVEPTAGQNDYEALMALERVVGRHFHVLRLYRALNNTTLRGAAAQEMKSRGQPMYLNITSEMGRRCVSWRSVAAGRYNSQLHSIARQVRRYHYKVYFSWNHEMQGNCSTGTAADYRASYKKVRKVFKKERVTNAVWVWVVAAGNMNHDPAKAARYLPRHVDLIGVDGYNRAGEWRSVKEIFAAAHRFAANRGIRLFIGEVGCAEDPSDSTAKARWISKAFDTFKKWNVAGVVWTEHAAQHGQLPR